MKKLFLVALLGMSMAAMAQQVTPLEVTVVDLKLDSLRTLYLSEPTVYSAVLEVLDGKLAENGKQIKAAKTTLKAEQKHSKEMGVALKDATKMTANLKKLYAKEDSELKAMQKNIEKQQKTLSKQSDLNDASRDAYRRLLDKEARELEYASEEVQNRVSDMNSLEGTLQTEQSNLERFNKQIEEKTQKLVELENLYKERVAALKAEQKAAKALH